MSEQVAIAREEAEEAKKQAEKAALRFRSIERSQARGLPLTPEQTLGRRPSEAVRHRRAVVVEGPPPKPARVIRVKQPRPSRRRFGRRPRIIGGPVFHRQALTHVRLREGTPANISRAEKDKSLRRLDAAIADWSRRYTFRVVHGGTPQEKNEAAMRLRELNAEKEAIEAMKPLGLPEHIRRAEAIES